MLLVNEFFSVKNQGRHKGELVTEYFKKVDGSKNINEYSDEELEMLADLIRIFIDLCKNFVVHDMFNIDQSLLNLCKLADNANVVGIVVRICNSEHRRYCCIDEYLGGLITAAWIRIVDAGLGKTIAAGFDLEKIWPIVAKRFPCAGACLRE